MAEQRLSELSMDDWVLIDGVPHLRGTIAQDPELILVVDFGVLPPKIRARHGGTLVTHIEAPNDVVLEWDRGGEDPRCYMGESRLSRGWRG